MRYGNNLMTLKQVAQKFECSTMTIYNMRRRGLLSPVFPYGMGPGKPVLFTHEEVEALFDKLSSNIAVF
ncbi:MAG: helix-turn-helix domain-containing protein [Candidatus Riflebacteria bacterium]|nr:helix-turn-helix domain-containing protein [Candidatus Riflebacteria bacterium]